MLDMGLGELCPQTGPAGLEGAEKLGLGSLLMYLNINISGLRKFLPCLNVWKQNGDNLNTT